MLFKKYKLYYIYFFRTLFFKIKRIIKVNIKIKHDKSNTNPLPLRHQQS
jgi:hypothetical protein